MIVGVLQVVENYVENREIHFANITVTSEYFVFNECFTADVQKCTVRWCMCLSCLFYGYQNGSKN